MEAPPQVWSQLLGGVMTGHPNYLRVLENRPIQAMGAYFFVFPCFHVMYIIITVRIKNNNSNGVNGNTVMVILPSGYPTETPPLAVACRKYT